MIQRCTNPNYTSWHNYGGRGIFVGARWRNSFRHFYDDMGDKPTGAELHRVNNDLGYCKSNCVWLGKSEHAKLHNKARHS
jgi:hypothetical protein